MMYIATAIESLGALAGDPARPMGTMLVIAALVAGTTVSEDLTCIAAGLLIARGDVSPVIGVLGCFLGIYFGDLGLYAVGRGGRGWIAKRIRFTAGSGTRAERLSRALHVNLPGALLAARFAPGLRLPTYVTAGLSGVRLRRFAGWSLLAAAVWTPLLVLAVAIGGRTVLDWIERWLGGGWLIAVGVAIAVLMLWRLIAILASSDGRTRLVVAVSRIWRWEFWPTWVFYAPLTPWLLWLWVRYGGPTTLTAANPALPDGGFVGESKSEILSMLPRECAAKWTRIDGGATGERVARLERWMADDAVRWPIILKPDAGQRGAGVRKIATAPDAAAYFERQPGAVVAQAYHAGPQEAGVFYYRMPGESRGRIYSITDKVFPVVIGDGVSTIDQLVRRHKRYRMQAATFLRRLDAARDTTPTVGERVPLAVAGNHCQGTMFRDGADLITPELERAIDRIARSVDGFYIGRFDIRYTDRAAFTAGRDLAIIELNGVTSESTNIYDPRRSLGWAYRTLGRQWELAYRIGWLNRRAGERVTPIRRLLCTVIGFYRGRGGDLGAD